MFKKLEWRPRRHHHYSRPKRSRTHPSAVDAARGRRHRSSRVARGPDGQSLERHRLVPEDVELKAAKPDDFDALVVPGGVIDKLRLIPEAVNFVQSFFAAKKPVFAICHGSQMLIEADVDKGRTLIKG